MNSKLRAWPILTFLQQDFILKIRMVLVFGNSGKSCIIVTKERMVYGLGDNTGGCLGIDSSEINTTYPKPIQELNGQDIKTLTHYNNKSDTYVAALTKSGNVYIWGQTGSFMNRKPLRLETNTYVVEIACGIHHCIALADDGLIYRWHHLSPGELIKLKISYFNDNFMYGKVVGISCGFSHCVAITNSGSTFIQSDFTMMQNVDFPDQLPDSSWRLEQLTGVVIEKVVCGSRHCLALSIDGCVYSMGDNSYGQLGLDEISEVANSWQKVCLHSKILDIAASPMCNISVAMAINYDIYIWGDCLKNRMTPPTLIPKQTIYDVFGYYAFPRVMHQPLVISDEEKEEDNEELENLLDYLKVAFDDINTSDLHIEVQGKFIYVHKAILKIRSKYFTAMFQQWSENEQCVMKISDYSYDVYRAFLEFLYTNDFSLPKEDVGELLKLADYCGEDELKTRCEFRLMENLSLAEVVPMYTQALLHNATILRDNCIDFSAKHMTEIVHSEMWKEVTADIFKQFILEVDKKHSIFVT